MGGFKTLEKISPKSEKEKVKLNVLKVKIIIISSNGLAEITCMFSFFHLHTRFHLK